MEGKSTVDVLIILGTSGMALFAFITAIFFIVYQRRWFIKETMTTFYKDECKSEIDKLKQESALMHKEIDLLKKEIDVLKSRVKELENFK